MGRDLTEQRNLWGTTGATAINAQRADLWTMDLFNVVQSLNAQLLVSENLTLPPLQPIPVYFLQSVQLPELKTNAEAYRRESRPYMMPAQDEPLGEIKVKFYLENPQNPRGSVVYRLLDTWRAFVRGGRGAYTREGSVPQLDSNFKLSYAFDTSITLFKGSSVPLFVETLTAQDEVNAHYPLGATNDLERCGTYTLDSTWLSAFRITELNYTQGNQLALIEATFYADNLVDLTANLTNV